MKTPKPLRNFFIFIILTASVAFLSCDVFEDTSDYDIQIMIVCSGSGTQEFTATFIIDNKTPLPIGATISSFIYPAGKIEAATISATRTNSTDTLMILVYKDGTLEDKGYAVLQSCNTSSSTTYCSDTLSLQYEIDAKDETTSGTAAATSSTTSTTTSE